MRGGHYDAPQRNAEFKYRHVRAVSHVTLFFENYIFKITIEVIVIINFFNWIFTKCVCYCVGVNLTWLPSMQAPASS